MAIPLALNEVSEMSREEYSSLDKDEAKEILRKLCSKKGDERGEFRVVSDNILVIYDKIKQIQGEMVEMFNSLTTCMEMLKVYLADSIETPTTIRDGNNTASDSSDTCISFNYNSGYNFPLASRVKCNCFLKIVVNHAVAGLYIGKNGTHLKKLQNQLQFKLTQSGRGAKGDFTGVGYPCHRTNTTLLFEGNLVNILYALRPLYRIIQDDILALDKKSLEILSGRSLRVKFELNLVVPADRKRILLQDAGRRCMQLRNDSGVDIIAGKQNFELGNIRESILTLLGFEESVERACEWLGIFLQESAAISSGDYSFMDYPKYTLAIPEGTRH